MTRSKQVRSVVKKKDCYSIKFWTTYLSIISLVSALCLYSYYYHKHVVNVTSVAVWPHMTGVDNSLEKCETELQSAFTRGFQAGHDKR